MGSVATLFVTSYTRPVAKHQMARSIVLGRSNKIWCPYADDKSILETFEKEQKERMQAAWQRANETKRLKKKQL